MAAGCDGVMGADDVVEAFGLGLIDPFAWVAPHPANTIGANSISAALLFLRCLIFPSFFPHNSLHTIDYGRQKPVLAPR